MLVGIDIGEIIVKSGGVAKVGFQNTRENSIACDFQANATLLQMARLLKAAVQVGYRFSAARCVLHALGASGSAQHNEVHEYRRLPHILIAWIIGRDFEPHVKILSSSPSEKNKYFPCMPINVLVRPQLSLYAVALQLRMLIGS